MPLEEYRRKRDFGVTTEPAGAPVPAETDPGSGQLTFVVHKHAARQLHYDVRLEIGGAYASWAVPKGPSLDPAEKRLAVHVEDHPLEYGSFEGVIPAGEYGAGTVMVWDRGTFSPVGDPVALVEKGHVKFVLEGSKLRGTFALVRMKPRPGEKREMWLLMKERDAEARPGPDYDVLAAAPDSAASGRTMEQIAASGVAWTGGGVEGADAARPAQPGALAGPLPADAPFQLATLVEQAPEGAEWLHEIKYDGYRLRVLLERGRARVRTRNAADWTDRFEPLARAVEALPATSALLDGEAVVLADDGRSDFGLLQEALASKQPGRVVFEAFDLLYLDGFDLRGETLLRRKDLLRALLETAPPGAPLRYVEHFAGDGPALLSSSCELLLEGSVSKRGDRPWVPGRSQDWLKAKCLERQEFVVAGWTDPAGSRTALGALLLGVHDEAGALRYAGRVGTGLSETTLSALRARLATLETKDPPFPRPPRVKGAHWVRPELVAQVAFREWTRDGVVRQPSFQGLREDADPASVVRERASAHAGPAVSAVPLVVAGVRVSNPDKVLLPAGVTKRELARYYEAVADAMLPHLAGRFITAVRCPQGLAGAGDCFYQRHPEARGWPVALHVSRVQEKAGVAFYFFVDDPAGLLASVQLGVLEIHAWNSLADDPERPDRIVFDLDPGPGVGWAAIVRAAATVRDALHALGLAAYAKTTGGRGVHVVVPIVPEHGYDAVRDLAHALCDRLAAHDPATFTAKMAKTARPGRVFVDYLRNAHGATAVCAFSTRARPGASVSVPVSWQELAAEIDPSSFTIFTVPRRLASLPADPWQGYDAARERLGPALFAALDVPVLDD